MEHAFLKLWHSPREAAEELDALSTVDEQLAGEIRQRLQGYVSTDAEKPTEERIPLPWCLDDLPGSTRQRLSDLGLDVGEGRLRQSGRLGLALGVLAGLGLALVLPSRSKETVTVSPPQLVRESRPCVDGDDEAQIWRCARPTTIREAIEWPRRRWAVLELPADDPDVQSLAQTLLDSGSADAVLLGRKAANRLGELTVQRGDELLWFISPDASAPDLVTYVGDWAVLTIHDAAGLDRRLKALRRPVRLADLEPGLTEVKKGDGRLLLHYCPSLRGVHEMTGMPFVWVCGGRFKMGSEDDPGAFDDEQPAHDVDITGFWMSEHEVSNQEFRRLEASHPDDDDLPRTRIDWYDARSFCESLGESDEWIYDLPSEAQWEYAARGNTGRRYPWGDEEPDDERAVGFRQASPKAVGSLPKGKGPFGTLDQAGNVWEWVRDCFDSGLYAKRVGGFVEDPVMMDEGQCEQFAISSGATSAFRVVRGGSFFDDPRVLRSAYRNGRGPGNWLVDRGFRCVRIPRRQP